MVRPMATDTWLIQREPEAPVSLIVGTMNFGKRTPAAEAERIVALSLERGLRYFDTANAYNAGESERILGRALKGRRDGARIATKVGIGRAGPNEGLAPERIRAALDESLERLGTDYVDLYYLHAPDPKTPLEATIEALDGLLKAGKIRAWGVSNYAAWQICEMFHICKTGAFARPAISQVLYNLLIRQLDLEYFAFAKQSGIHTTVYNPLAGGLLAGKGLGNKIEPGSRFDNNKMYQRRYLSDRFFELTQAYAQLARDSGLDPVQFAYAFVAQKPGIDSILLGPATEAQLEAGIAGAALHLSKELVEQANEIHRAYLGTDVSYAR